MSIGAEPECGRDYSPLTAIQRFDAKPSHQSSQADEQWRRLRIGPSVDRDCSVLVSGYLPPARSPDCCVRRRFYISRRRHRAIRFHVGRLCCTSLPTGRVVVYIVAFSVWLTDLFESQHRVFFRFEDRCPVARYTGEGTVVGARCSLLISSRRTGFETQWRAYRATRGNGADRVMVV